MVMVDKQVKPQACWEFEAEVLVLHHPTTISTKYQAMGQYWENWITLLVMAGSLKRYDSLPRNLLSSFAE